MNQNHHFTSQNYDYKVTNFKYYERQASTNHSLYKVWLILKCGNTRTYYSFINRINPNKAEFYIKTIKNRMDVGYAWLIDNQSDQLLEVFENDYWRKPNQYEDFLFQINKHRKS